MDVVYFDFSKAFSTVSHNMLTGQLRKCGMDEWSVRWIVSWLDGRVQRVVLSGAESSWRPVCQHCHVHLPEAPLHLFPMPGPGGFSSVLSVASSSETLFYSTRNKELKEALRMLF